MYSIFFPDLSMGMEFSSLETVCVSAPTTLCTPSSVSTCPHRSSALRTCPRTSSLLACSPSNSLRSSLSALARSSTASCSASLCPSSMPSTRDDEEGGGAEADMAPGNENSTHQY